MRLDLFTNEMKFDVNVAHAASVVEVVGVFKSAVVVNVARGWLLSRVEKEIHDFAQPDTLGSCHI